MMNNNSQMESLHYPHTECCVGNLISQNNILNYCDHNHHQNLAENEFGNSVCSATQPDILQPHHMEISNQSQEDIIPPSHNPNPLLDQNSYGISDCNSPPNYFQQTGPNLSEQHSSPTKYTDLSSFTGLTGTHRVVDRYSITKFSTNEWRERNKDILNNAWRTFENSDQNGQNCKSTLLKTYLEADKVQNVSTKCLKGRTRDIDVRKCTLERGINAQIEEITALEEQRSRLKHSLAVLLMPETIARECLERRTARPETELVKDAPEVELSKELELIADIRRLLNDTLVKIEAQQIENKKARCRLEYDWSNKKDAYQIESINCGLNNSSTTTLFRPGATMFPAEQSSEEYWQHFTDENLEECEKSRQKSINLRSTLNCILMNAARDLRCHANIVEKAFSDRISSVQEILNKLENELRKCLQKLADTEMLIIKMTQGLEGLDNPMKVAQSRLYNRNERPHVENCRDRTQFTLLDEVQSIHDGAFNISHRINEAENTKNQLMITRGELEREIMLKKKSIMLDKERCMLIRSHFPSSTALSGYANI